MSAYDAIRAMPSRTQGDYGQILRAHVAELKALSAGLENDMMGLASGDASRYLLAQEISELALVVGIAAKQIERITEAASL